MMTFHLDSPCSKHRASIASGVVIKQILGFYGIAEALVDHHILISRVCSAQAGWSIFWEYPAETYLCSAIKDALITSYKRVNITCRGRCLKQPNQFKLALLAPKSLVFVLKNKHNLSVKEPLNPCLFISLFCLVFCVGFCGVFFPSANFSDWEAFCFCDKGELFTGTCNKPGLNFHLCSTHMVQVVSLNLVKMHT